MAQADTNRLTEISHLYKITEKLYNLGHIQHCQNNNYKCYYTYAKFN